MKDNSCLLQNIDDCVMESELSVINAILETYKKTEMILENYDGDDVSSFDIFTESFYMEDGEEKKSVGSKILSILKKIIFFVPSLVVRAIESIKKKLSKRNKTSVAAEAITNVNAETKEAADEAVDVISNSASVEEVIKVAEENGASKEDIEKIKITYKEAKMLEKKIMELFLENRYISSQQNLNANGRNNRKNGLKGILDLKKCAFVNLQNDPRRWLKTIDQNINFAKEVEKILKKPIGDLEERIRFADRMIWNDDIKNLSDLSKIDKSDKTNKPTKTNISITFTEYKKFVEDINKKFDELKTITDRTFNAYTMEDVKKIAKDSSLNKDVMEEKLQKLSSVMVEFGQGTTRLINNVVSDIQPFDLTLEYIDKYIIVNKGSKAKTAAIAGGAAVGVVGLSLLARFVVGKVKSNKKKSPNNDNIIDVDFEEID